MSNDIIFNPEYLYSNIIFVKPKNKYVFIEKHAWNTIFTTLFQGLDRNPVNSRKLKSVIYDLYTMRDTISTEEFNRILFCLNTSRVQIGNDNPDVNFATNEGTGLQEKFLNDESVMKNTSLVWIGEQKEIFTEYVDNILNLMLSFDKQTETLITFCIGYQKCKNIINNYLINNQIYVNGEYEKEFSHLMARYGIYNDLKKRKESGNCLDCRCDKCRGKSDFGSCQHCSDTHYCKHHLYKDEYCIDCNCVNCHNNRGTIYTRNLVQKLNDKHQIYKFDNDDFYKDDKSFLNSYKTPYTILNECKKQNELEEKIQRIGITAKHYEKSCDDSFKSSIKQIIVENVNVLKRDEDDYFQLPNNRTDITDKITKDLSPNNRKEFTFVDSFISSDNKNFKVNLDLGSQNRSSSFTLNRKDNNNDENSKPFRRFDSLFK